MAAHGAAPVCWPWLPWAFISCGISGRPSLGRGGDRQLRQAVWLIIPLTIYSGYLQYTHVIRLAADGSYHVGQSTYGDLPMHLSFITSLKNASFPPEYSFYPGHRLSYPFLMDSLSTSFYMMGCSLQAAVIIPGTLMMGLCYLGVVLLAREMTLGKKTIVLAALLFFLNGGWASCTTLTRRRGWRPTARPRYWCG